MLKFSFLSASRITRCHIKDNGLVLMTWPKTYLFRSNVFILLCLDDSCLLLKNLAPAACEFNCSTVAPPFVTKKSILVNFRRSPITFSIALAARFAQNTTDWSFYELSIGTSQNWVWTLICQISLASGVASISIPWDPAKIAKPFGTILRA